MKPKELIEKWVELFNEGNPEKIVELYHLDAINHQVANKPVEGKKAIGEMFTTEFNTVDMTCIPENIFEDGEWAILEWKRSEERRVGQGIGCRKAPENKKRTDT